MRTEACFTAESLDGPFVGRDVLEDDRGYCEQGVAQGGAVCVFGEGDGGGGQVYGVPV